MTLRKTFVLGVLALLPLLASAQQYKMLEDIPEIGTRIRKVAMTGSLPFDKTYAELTPQQREALRSNYDGMPDNEEPPFPLDGLAPMCRILIEGAGRFQARGGLVMHVHVNSEGKATKVDIYETPGQEMTQLAARVAMRTKFKPAVCAGKPCAMSFPVSVIFH